MANSWAAFKQFPNRQFGEYVEAPIGPGVYEVRHVLTGELVAFGHAANVAQALASLSPDPSLMSWLTGLIRGDIRYAINELEYRTCAAKTLNEAKTITTCLAGRREAYMKRRAVVRLA